MTTITRVAAVFVLAALAACGSSEPTPPPNGTNPKTEPDVKKPLPGSQSTIDVRKLDLLKGLDRRVLENGMTVLVKEDRRLPMVSTVLTYRIGSVHEKDGETGLAHFLEHMMFKGTDKYRKGDIDWITYLAGGMNNAYTSEDMTSYYFTVSSDTLNQFLELEANRMRGCTLDKTEFEAERGPVLSELGGRLDTPWGRLYYEMEQKIWKSHSYRHPTIGYRADVEKMTYEQMKAFYDAYYGPNNATLVVVGDCDKEQVFAKVKELFGPIAKVKTPVVPVATEPPQTAENRFDVTSKNVVGRLGLAFRTAKVGTAEDYILDLVSSILAGGEDARLDKRLIVKDGMAITVEAANEARQHDGVFWIFCEMAKGRKIEEAEAAIGEELEKIAKEGVPERELQKVKNLRAAQFVYDKEEQYNVADAIARFEALGVPDYLKSYLARIDAVKPADIQRVVKAIFQKANRTVGYAPPGKKSSGGARDRRGWKAAKQQGTGPAPEFGEYYETRLPNGLTVCVKPVRHLPIQVMRAYVNAGFVNEDPAKAGVAHLVADLLDQGVAPPTGTPRSAEEIAEQVAFIGGQLTTGQTGASIKVTSNHATFAWDLLRDVVLYPTFPADKVIDKRDHQLDELAAMQDSPAEVAQMKLYEAIYPGHPMQRPGLGLEATVKNLTRDDVLAHYRRFFRPENTIIAIAGDVDPQAVVEEVKKRFGEWAGKGEFVAPSFPRIAPQEKPLLITEYRMEKLQCNYALGHLSVDRSNPDWYALKVLEYVFCRGTGFTDRLSHHVRDDLGLAYTIGGDITSGADEWPGPFVIVFGSEAAKCDPEKQKPTAYEETMRMLRELVDKGATDKEVDAAKLYLLRAFSQRWETTDNLATYMITVKRMNLGIDYSLKFRRAISAVTKDDVARVAKAYLHPDAITTVIVGPVDKDGKVKTEK